MVPRYHIGLIIKMSRNFLLSWNPCISEYVSAWLKITVARGAMYSPDPDIGVNIYFLRPNTDKHSDRNNGKCRHTIWTQRKMTNANCQTMKVLGRIT